MKAQNVAAAEQVLAYLAEATRFVLLARKGLDSSPDPSLPHYQDFYDVAEAIEKIEHDVAEAISKMVAPQTKGSHD